MNIKITIFLTILLINISKIYCMQPFMPLTENDKLLQLTKDGEYMNYKKEYTYTDPERGTILYQFYLYFNISNQKFYFATQGDETVKNRHIVYIDLSGNHKLADFYDATGIIIDKRNIQSLVKALKIDIQELAKIKRECMHLPPFVN